MEKQTGKNIVNPCYCCCGLQWGVRSIAIVSIILEIALLIYVIVDCILKLPGLKEAEERLREARGSGSNSSNKTEEVKDLKAKAHGAWEAVIGSGIIFGVCVLELTLAIVLLCGANRRKIGKLKCWMGVTIFLLVLRLLVLIFAVAHKDIGTLICNSVVCGLTIYYLIVVFCYIRELREYPEGRAVAVAQGKTGMPAPEQMPGVFYQETLVDPLIAAESNQQQQATGLSKKKSSVKRSSAELKGLSKKKSVTRKSVELSQQQQATGLSKKKSSVKRSSGELSQPAAKRLSKKSLN